MGTIHPFSPDAEAIRQRRARAIQSALRCAATALEPTTDPETQIALLMAVGRYAEQLRPSASYGGAAR